MSNEGKTVKVHYKGTLDDGTVFDSSYDRGEPIEFTCMGGQVIPGFDEGVKDLAVGETTTIHIEPEDAYGPYREELIDQIPVENIPNADQLPVGQVIYLTGRDGTPMPAKVASIEDGMVTFDFNHPMAGKPLNFDLELVEVVD